MMVKEGVFIVAEQGKVRKIISGGALAFAFFFANVGVVASLGISLSFVSSGTEIAEAAVHDNSAKVELKPYLHDYSGQVSSAEHNGKFGIFFDDSDPSAITLSNKLYINVENAQNLKTKQDVENFINNGTCLTLMVDRTDPNVKDQIVAIDQDNCKIPTDSDQQTDFQKQISVMLGNQESVHEPEQAPKSIVNASITNNCNSTDACIFTSQGNVGFLGDACYIGEWKNMMKILAQNRDASFYYDANRYIRIPKGNNSLTFQGAKPTVNTVIVY
jgi:hypothetical protein